jgi:hypothetical protein
VSPPANRIRRRSCPPCANTPRGAGSHIQGVRGSRQWPRGAAPSQAPERPGLSRTDGRCEPPEFDCVLVWKYDRFARSLSILVTALQQFSTLGIDFISYIQNIDTTTAMGASLLSRDRDDRRARSSGPRKCPCKGQSLGRPKDRTAELRILALRKQGLSLGRLHTARSGQPPVCAKSSAAPPCLEDSIE